MSRLSDKARRGFQTSAPRCAATVMLVPGGLVNSWVQEARATGKSISVGVVALLQAGYR